MPLTLAQSYARVAVNLQDVDASTGLPAYVFWRKAWLVDWINDAVKAITRAVPQKRYITFSANPNPVIIAHRTAEYVPATYETLSVLHFVQAGTSRCAPKSIAWLADQYIDWDTRTGTPAFVVYNEFAPGVVKLVPDPGETLATVRGLATVKIQPLVVTTDDDTPLPVDDEDFHELVELFATAKALRSGPEEVRDIAQSDRLMALYVMGLGEYKKKQAGNYNDAPRSLDFEQF